MIIRDLASIAIDIKLTSNIVMRRNGMFFKGFAWTWRDHVRLVSRVERSYL
jgi:hypothetical protein